MCPGANKRAKAVAAVNDAAGQGGKCKRRCVIDGECRTNGLTTEMNEDGGGALRANARIFAAPSFTYQCGDDESLPTGGVGYEASAVSELDVLGSVPKSATLRHVTHLLVLMVGFRAF